MTAEHENLLKTLLNLRSILLSEEEGLKHKLQSISPEYNYAARNLLHYLSLRRQDLRELQDDLTAQGLSSLRYAESHVLENLNRVIKWLDPADTPPDLPVKSPAEAGKEIREKSCSLFHAGDKCPDRFVMVTLDGTSGRSSKDYSELIEAGMNCARINTGHDNQEVWQYLIGEIREASRITGKSCAVYLDLAGPKIRIDEIISKHGDKKNKVFLKKGFKLFITESGFKPGSPRLTHVVIGTKGILRNLEVGNRILFDDGVVGAEVTHVEKEGVLVEITFTDGPEKKIKIQKGVIFPGIPLQLPAVTREDFDNILLFGKEVDILGISFVHSPEEIRSLIQFLRTHHLNHLGVVAKIETFRAFENLPEILFALMEIEKSGVMIARGDLGLEVGFERLAEVQEEILWMCEAALMPSIWATQVLENLTKKGMATRSEITDAAMSVRAECVMLNKGPYIMQSVIALTKILNAMSHHQRKKRPIMRKLHLSERFFEQS